METQQAFVPSKGPEDSQHSMLTRLYDVGTQTSFLYLGFPKTDNGQSKESNMDKSI